MLKNLKKFIQNLQAADEAKKKRWLFFLSAIAMILIVSSWLIYLNKTIVNLGPAESNNQPTIKIPKESPWEVFLTGIKTIISQIKELITATHQISIEGNNLNFGEISNTTSTPKEINNSLPKEGN